MNRCILVFGMPRSGTTWIGKLFDSHPDTLYRHEPDSVRRLTLPLFPEKKNAPQYRRELQGFVASLPYLRSSKVVGKQPLFPKHYQSAAALLAYRVSVAATKAVGHIKQNLSSPWRPTAKGYAHASLVWKSIESPGRLGVCMETLPNAGAIYILRHPCGYVASVLRGEAARRFRSLAPSSEDYGFLELLLATPVAQAHKLELSDLRKLAPEERLAWRWVLTNEHALQETAQSRRVLAVRYEDICGDPITQTRKMFEFASLDWSLQTEKFVKASTQTADASYYGVFKYSQASAERWRSELEPEVAERILRIFHSSRLYRFYTEGVQTPTASVEAAV